MIREQGIERADSWPCTILKSEPSRGDEGGASRWKLPTQCYSTLSPPSLMEGAFFSILFKGKMFMD